mmetsp:Transcript_42787/g.107985  ORF Transcript_42787/g.107985 Transcript_42787/m.107985 type:complete len:219 (-) Transcript_42787:124-780(-)
MWPQKPTAFTLPSSVQHRHASPAAASSAARSTGGRAAGSPHSADVPPATHCSDCAKFRRRADATSCKRTAARGHCGPSAARERGTHVEGGRAASGVDTTTPRLPAPLRPRLLRPPTPALPPRGTGAAGPAAAGAGSAASAEPAAGAAAGAERADAGPPLPARLRPPCCVVTPALCVPAPSVLSLPRRPRPRPRPRPLPCSSMHARGRDGGRCPPDPNN